MQSVLRQEPSRDSYWQLSSPGRIFFRDDEPLAVYFDVGSGDTHLVSQEAVSVLERLMVGTLSIGEVATILRNESDDVSDAELLDHSIALIENLESLDIVEVM